MNYMIITEVGNALIRLLREKMVPDIISNQDTILLCSPSDKGDAVLGLYLYDIKECEEYKETIMKNISVSQQRYPSTYLSLYYMITAYSNGDVKFRSSEEQKILGKVIQIFKDCRLLHNKTLEPVQKNDYNSIQVEVISMDMEEKLRIWNVPNIAYKLSIYLKVSPIELESERIKDIQRVTDITLEMEEKR